jgi:hypothetical protein
MMPSALDVWAVVRIFVFGKDVGGSLRPYGACTSSPLPRHPALGPRRSATRFKKFFPWGVEKKGRRKRAKFQSFLRNKEKELPKVPPLPSDGSIKRFTAVRLDVCLAAFYSSQLQQKSMKTVANQNRFCFFICREAWIEIAKICWAWWSTPLQEDGTYFMQFPHRHRFHINWCNRIFTVDITTIECLQLDLDLGLRTSR